MKKKPHTPCPDCGDAVSRRSFLKSATTAAAATAVLPFGAVTFPVAAKEAKAKSPKAETLVKSLYDSLDEKQRGELCFGFDHPLRSKVDNNWHILKKHRIAGSFNKDQQALIREIFLNIHSEEYRGAVMKQVEHDNGKGGFGSCSVALFGKPGTGKFEFVFTGRHVTRRCDGDSLEGAAFGGPIFYGHAARSFNEDPDHKDNVYWYQSKRVNEVFQMMNGKQRKQALLGDSRGEHGNKTVELSGKVDGLAGIPMSELTADQKDLARKALGDLLMPFREVDRKESMKLIEKSGFDRLHLSFYKNEDVGNDGVWDVFQVEGPNMVWYFRGDPHIHAWLHIRDEA